MLVKYIGHGDMISSDWHGKRYVFSKRNPIIDIPDGLYDNIKSSNFVLKNAIVFVERPTEHPVVLQDEEDLEEVIEKRGPGRPKKDK